MNYTDPLGLLIDGGILTGPAAYVVGSTIAAGILYYGAPVAADIGQWLGDKLFNEGAEGGDSCSPSDDNGTIYVDPNGNAIPTPQGGGITGSPNGDYIQGRDANGNPTGVRKDGGHNPSGHPDPRAQAPHGHVPGVTNPDGTPWLPVR